MPRFQESSVTIKFVTDSKLVAKERKKAYADAVRQGY